MNISKLKLGVKYDKIKIDLLMYADDVINVTTCSDEAELMLNEINGS